MPELKEKKTHRVLRLLAQRENTQNLKESVELAIRIGDSCPDITEKGKALNTTQ
jgi:hypothetical protein